MEKLTHIILTPLYPPARFGGIEKIVQSLAEGLVNLGDEVAVFSFDPSSSRTQRDDCSDTLIQIHRVACPTTAGSLAEIVAAQSRMAETILESNAGRAKTAVIHAHDWFVGPAALFLRNRLNIPLVTIFHSDKRSEYGNRINGDRKTIHELQKSLAHGSDGILCYSRFMQMCISSSMEIGFEQIDTFTCGIDDNVRKRSSLPSATLLYLGRLAPEKDVATLIRAFRRILDKRSDCNLKIVGDGSERLRLGELVAELGLTGRVIFSPFTANQERVDEELLGAGALILPSIFEPFGLVVLEAISRLVPVIVPASGGPSEIVRGGITGWCFAPGDEEELAEKIFECLEDPTRAARMASRAFEDASQRFQWMSGVLKLRDTCRSLVVNRPANGDARC